MSDVQNPLKAEKEENQKELLTKVKKLKAARHHQNAVTLVEVNVKMITNAERITTPGLVENNIAMRDMFPRGAPTATAAAAILPRLYEDNNRELESRPTTLGDGYTKTWTQRPNFKV